MVVVLDVAPRAGYRIWLPYSDGASGDVDLSDEALIYRHLGDWIVRQKADREHGVEGAEGRLAAAYDLQNQLAKIIGGELPCDLFVRWRPLGEPPIGWEPDINDDVRINIRPFMLAELTREGRAGTGVLRAKPKIACTRTVGRKHSNRPTALEAAVA